jgi:hypothetical protein
MRRTSHPLRRTPAGRAPVVPLLLVLLAGCTEVAGSTDDGGETVFVVVGDSITAGGEALAGREVPDGGSWVPAAAGEPLTFGGGWAVPGATTADMRSGVRPVDGDVLVLMGGTNDLAQGVEWAATRDNLLTVTRTLRIDDVLLAAVPPFDPDPEAATTLDERLQALAAEQDWTFVDPWVAVREDGGYAEGASLDGIHPVQQVADDAGRRIRSALLATVGG